MNARRSAANFFCRLLAAYDFPEHCGQPRHDVVAREFAEHGGHVGSPVLRAAFPGVGLDVFEDASGAAAGGFDHFGNVAVDVEIGRGGVELVRFKPDSFGRRGVVVLAVDCVAHADYLPLAFGNEPLYGVVRADFPLDENYFLGVYHRFCWNFRGVV